MGLKPENEALYINNKIKICKLDIYFSILKKKTICTILYTKALILAFICIHNSNKKMLSTYLTVQYAGLLQKDNTHIRDREFEI